MNPLCPRCGAEDSIKFGRYHRVDDAQSIQRYRCKVCSKCHASATHAPTYRQKRRRLNHLIEWDVGSSTSQRRIAFKLGCTRKTVARKISFLAQQARVNNAIWLNEHGPFDNVQWDELITFEHSRLKPLTVAVMSCATTRCVIGFGVAPIPAYGKIANRSREKYGHRVNKSAAMRKQVLSSVAHLITPTATIKSDQHKQYAREINKTFPKATHIQYVSERGSLTGQGELKRGGFDPLFGINHTLAMFRDNLKRLARRTWCTTKKMSGLQEELEVYVHFHNSKLIPRPTSFPNKNND